MMVPFKRFYILKGFQQKSGRLDRVNAVTEGNGSTVSHIIHFCQFFSFGVAGNGANRMNIDRKRNLISERYIQRPIYYGSQA